MANRYANLVGSNKIKDEYTKINTGFDKVEQEMDEKPDNSFAKINDVEAEGEDAVTIEAGTGITITTTPEEKKIRITATGEATPGPHGPEHNHDGADPIPDLVQLRDGFDDYKNEIRSLGLGIDVDPRISSDLNNETQTGWVRFESGETANSPGEQINSFPHSGVVRVDRRNNSRLVQTAYGVAGGTGVRIAVRVLGSTGWGDWVEMLHTGNTTNIVNQEYEVGSWTPSFTTTGNPIEEVTYSGSSIGSYVRVGALVFIHFNMSTLRLIKGNASGELRITGLPFMSASTTALSISRVLAMDTSTANSYSRWRMAILLNSPDIVIYTNSSDASASTLTVDALQDHTSSTYNVISATGMYHIIS